MNTRTSNAVGNAFARCTFNDLELIDLVVRRYCGDHPRPGRPIVLAIDLMLAHAAVPLDLTALLHANDYDFHREVVGLHANIDRVTGELANYRPRFARGEVAA